MSEQERNTEFATLVKRARIVLVLCVALMLPRIILTISTLESVLGLSYETALYPMLVGAVIYGLFLFKYWKCPECDALLRGGWFVSDCKKCGSELK